MNVVFLDRDGTVITEPPDERVDSVKKIALLPDSLAALKFLADNDCAVVFVTNQAGIAEGRMTEVQFWDIHNEVLRQLAPSGIKVLKTYMNAEAGGPEASEWRKPGPKMLLQAAQDFGLNLNETYMIGDRPTDVLAANNARCKGGVLLQMDSTGSVSEAVFVAPNLLAAVEFCVAH